MPTPAQAEALATLLDTQTPLVVTETHEEKRLLALAEAVARRSQRALWTWSASKGLRCLQGSHEALAAARAAVAADVLAELRRTRPLSVTPAEAIGALRTWAAGRAVDAG